jgi:hypothetical protein
VIIERGNLPTEEIWLTNFANAFSPATGRRGSCIWATTSGATATGWRCKIKYECFFLVADLHMLTTKPDKESILAIADNATQHRHGSSWRSASTRRR